MTTNVFYGKVKLKTKMSKFNLLIETCQFQDEIVSGQRPFGAQIDCGIVKCIDLQRQCDNMNSKTFKTRKFKPPAI